MFGQTFRISNSNHSEKRWDIKLALKSRELNNQKHENKYQMPNIEKLMDGISQIIAERKDEEVFSTTLDLTYAYGIIALEEKTSERCNVSLVEEKSKGNYHFKNEFHGLTTMPAEFQKVIDTLIKNFSQAHAFNDDILIVSKSTKIEQNSLVEKILKNINVANTALKLQKSKFAKLCCQWLGHNINNNRTTPLVRKMKAIDEL